MRDYFEYGCVGRASVKKAAFFICASIISGMLFGIASVEDSFFSPYFKLFFLGFLLLSVLIFARFIGTRYYYQLIGRSFDEADLVITELRGFFGKESAVKVKRTVCRVSVKSIADITEINAGTDGRKMIKSIKKAARSERAAVYNYVADLFPSEYVIVKIEDEDGISYVRFSPDEELLGLMRTITSRTLQ